VSDQSTRGRAARDRRDTSGYVGHDGLFKDTCRISGFVRGGPGRADGKGAGALFLRDGLVTGGAVTGVLRVDGREGAQAQEQKAREKEPKKRGRSWGSHGRVPWFVLRVHVERKKPVRHPRLDEHSQNRTRRRRADPERSMSRTTDRRVADRSVCGNAESRKGVKGPPHVCVHRQVVGEAAGLLEG
jgi:hypothetical protein